MALANSASAKPAGLYALEAKGIDGKMVSLSQYEGKVTLVVNTASQCGFTPQYKDLEALYEKYKDKGFTILGFPSNNFGSQEPGSDAEIKTFCDNTFHVKFPLFSKNDVKGPGKQPVYKFLTSGAKYQDEVAWNFEKFLVDKTGNVVARYKSKVTPLSAEVTKEIDTLIK